MMNTYFPNPAEHATVMLEVCGTLEAAQKAASTNIDFATTHKDYAYWNAVREALRAEVHPCGEN